MASRNTNMTAKALGALALDEHRTYLLVWAATDITVTLSSGTPFTILANTHWEPTPAPINDIAFTGTGTIVVG